MDHQNIVECIRSSEGSVEAFKQALQGVEISLDKKLVTPLARVLEEVFPVGGKEQERPANYEENMKKRAYLSVVINAWHHKHNLLLIKE